MAMAVIAAVMRRFKELLRLMPGQVGEEAVLNVATKEALLRERHCILIGVDSPAHHPAEEKWAVGLACHVLVQVELEKLLFTCCLLLHNVSLSLACSLACAASSQIILILIKSYIN